MANAQVRLEKKAKCVVYLHMQVIGPKANRDYGMAADLRCMATLNTVDTVMGWFLRQEKVKSKSSDDVKYVLGSVVRVSDNTVQVTLEGETANVEDGLQFRIGGLLKDDLAALLDYLLITPVEDKVVGKEVKNGIAKV